jgi:hypothetical protein
MPRWTTLRTMGGLRRLVLRGTLFLLFTLLVWPVLLILPLNVVQPPTTAVMLARTVQRWRADKSPAYPRREVVPRRDLAASAPRRVRRRG